MIASRLGLAIAGAVAVLLGLVLAIDLSRQAVVVERALVAGFDADQVTALRWRRSCAATQPGCVPLVELRQTNATWRWATDGAPVDRDASNAVLSALRGAHWHRRGGPTPSADAVTLEVVAGARTTKLAIGPALEGGAQTWIARDGTSLLVDDWVARALTPAPLALRLRRPFADAAAASRIVLERVEQAEPAATIRVEGSPRRLVKPSSYLLVPAIAKELELALAALEIVAFAPPAGATPPSSSGSRWTITVDAPLLVTIDIGGACSDPAHVAIAGTAGTGCVARGAVEAIERAVHAVGDPTAVDPRPLPIEPVTITLVDGSVLDLSKRARIGDRDADADRVAKLLAALATPGELVALPAVAASAKLAITDRANATHELQLFGDQLVARAGEPRAIRITAADEALLRSTADALADKTIWAEEPTTIAAIAIDQTTYTRGAVLGEWTRSGPGADLPGVVEQLAGLLARPRSLGAHMLATLPRTLVVTVAPPTSAARTRTLQLGSTPQGCAAIVDGAKHLVASEICALVARLRR